MEQAERESSRGMPLGNLTSQFFANVYLNELDYFVKHKLRAKCYIRYVDDFVILHRSREKLVDWKLQINSFLTNELKIQLHPDKSRVSPLAKGIDFVGFRNYHHFRLLRKRNIRSMRKKIKLFEKEKVSKEQILESFQGWQAYAKWANTYKLRTELSKNLIE